MLEIKDDLIKLPIKLGNNFKTTRDNIVRIILDNQGNVKETFKNDEYLILDIDNSEIVGLSPSLSDTGLPEIQYVLSKKDKYKNSMLFTLGNAGTLYDEVKNHYSNIMEEKGL